MLAVSNDNKGVNIHFFFFILLPILLSDLKIIQMTKKTTVNKKSVLLNRVEGGHKITKKKKMTDCVFVVITSVT